MDDAEATARTVTPGLCPRCSEPLPQRWTGRPTKWCSQRCRRAAYEERRAAASGAVALQFVEVAGAEVDHDLSECAQRVAVSPAACRRVLRALTKSARAGNLQYDAKWQGTLEAVAGLADALVNQRSGARRRG